MLKKNKTIKHRATTSEHSINKFIKHQYLCSRLPTHEKINPLIKLTKAFSIVLVLLTMSTGIAADLINKSPADSRTYDTFTLKNGIEVITVSDPSLTTSAATISVGVGQYQDPESHQGLAHFLEHMIFMGSEKHPKPNEYLEFIKNNGGNANAFTAPQQTTYLLSINAEQYAPALDRLSSAIASPLFDKTMIEKEINAVNSEWLLHYQADQFIWQRVAAHTGNTAHPRFKLGVGNNKTLNKKGSDLVAALKNFHYQHYSANIMKLTLVGKQSSEQLKKLAKEYFSSIENKEINRPVTSVNAYNAENLGQHIYIKSKVKLPILTIEFPVANNLSDWKNKPNEYITHLLNSEEEGSLLFTLREQGYIQTGRSIFAPNIWGHTGSAFLEYVLTEKGQNNQDDILRNTFQYIELIKQSGIKQAYFDELSAIKSMQFEDYRALPAPNLAMTLSQRVFDFPVKNIIDADYLVDRFEEEKINKVLSQLTVDSARIYHISPNEKAEKKLEYADGEYRTKPISVKEKDSWLSTEVALNLPTPQVLGQEKEVIVKLDGDFSTPQVVYSEPGVRAFMSESLHHKGKDGVLNLSLVSDVPAENADNLINAYILNTIYLKKNQRLFQRAQQRDGVMISTMLNGAGNATFRLFGRSRKQISLTNKLIDGFVNIEINEKNFLNAVKLYKDSLESIGDQKLLDQLNYYAMNATHRPPYLFEKDVILEALSKTTLESVKKMHATILKENYIDIYSHGNFSPEEIVEFSKSVREKLGTSQTKPWHLGSNFKMHKGRALFKNVVSNKDGVGLVDTYIYPEKSEQVLSQLHVINRLMTTPLFNDLRTNKQLGYIVKSAEENIHGFPSLSILVVSDNTELQKLKEYIIDFQYRFYLTLKNINEDTVETLAKALADELQKKPVNILTEVVPFLQDWEQNKLDFASQNRLINFVKSTTKQDLVSLYEKMFIEGSYMNVLTQIKGEDFSDSRYFSAKNIAAK
ncbi:insulinase family protein [Paraglaciecola sp.]|uniref:insulinase family protein n=1 Tax=Paraglaciecola sp. TaxID=1920173 RepID=UPI0032640F54